MVIGFHHEFQHIIIFFSKILSPKMSGTIVPAGTNTIVPFWHIEHVMQENFAQMVGGWGAEGTAQPVSVDSARAFLLKIRVKMGKIDKIMRSQPSIYRLSTDNGRRGLNQRTIYGRQTFLVSRRTLTDKRT